MNPFRVTTYLSEILEESHKQPVIVFKYSSECGTSDRLAKLLEDSALTAPIYKVTVQKHPVLSKKIEDHFGVKHESPQILIIKESKVTYTAHHNDIDIEKFVLE